MDSFILKNKSDFVKTISKSKLMERSFDKNKLSIRVNLKPKINLIYNDLVPNKEKTKKIMSNFFKPSLSSKNFNPPKKIQNDINNNTNNIRKEISFNSISNNNNISETEKKISVKKPVMNVLKYTHDIPNKRKDTKQNIYHLKRSSLDLKYDITSTIYKNNNKNKVNLFENNNNKINEKHNKISSSMDIYEDNNLNEERNDNKNNIKIQENLNENEYNENNIEINQYEKNPIYYNTNLKRSRNSFVNNFNNKNSSLDNDKMINPFLTDSELIGGKSMKNIITKRIFLPLKEINKTKTFAIPIENSHPLTERLELKKSGSDILNTINNINTIENSTISEDENEDSSNSREENKNTEILTIRIEDLIVLEEKFSNILGSFKNILQLKKFCIEWWTFYNYSSFYNVFENFFSDSQIKEKNIAHEYSVLEFLSIIVVHEVLKDNKINQYTLNCLNKLIYCVNQNFLIVCDYIISILPLYAKKSSWVKKLNLILEKKKENLNIFKNNHLDLLKTGNNNINILMKNILRLYNSNSKVNGNELIFYLSRSSRIYINTLNEYFKKKVNLEDYNINKNDFLKNGISKKNNNNNIQNNKIPYLQNKKDKKKIFTLVLDLDETLISYQNDEKGRGIFIPRPGLNQFLTEINKIYEIILFTSATQNYADPILDSIDKNKIFFDKRLYRQHTLLVNDTFVKDLSKLGRDLSKVVILDNRPQNYELQKENGIYIRSFYGDNKFDNALINLIPILKTIAKSPYNDVREEIKKLKEEIFTKVTTDLYDGNYI